MAGKEIRHRTRNIEKKYYNHATRGFYPVKTSLHCNTLSYYNIPQL